VIRAATWEEVRPKRRVNNKATFRGFVTDFIVPRPEDRLRPQAYLVEQEPGWMLPVHFHLEHQYQVVTAGGGTFGKHPVGPLFVHYASRESGYGPLSAGPDGLSYLTLRVVGDEGAWYLPESRTRMQTGIKRRQAHASPKTSMSEAELRALDGLAAEILITPDGSGLAACLARMPANHVAAAALCDCSGDRFYVVTKGSMIVGSHTVAGLATVFASAEEQVEIRAGAQGLEVLVLQFPDDARVASSER
jgi:hypothetical protein